MENSFIHACAGEDLVIPWNVTNDHDEITDDIKWTYRGALSEELTALWARGNFIATAPFSNRVEFIPTAGIVLKNAGSGDVGNYTVKVIGRENDRDVTLLRGEAEVLVAEPRTSSDDYLHAIQEPQAVKDSAGDWVVQLICGPLTSLGDPSVSDSVEWVTLSGLLKPPSTQHTGIDGTTFALLLRNPIQGGKYVCRLPAQHPAVSCLQANSSLRGESSVIVDEVKARLSLIEGQQGDLKKENEDLKAENSRLKDQIEVVESARLTDVANLTEMVGQLRNVVSVDYSNLTFDLHRVEETLGQCSCQQNLAQRISFHAQLGRDKVIQDNHVLILPDVQLNQGDFYNPATGVFSVPYNATYFFLITTGVTTANKFARLYLLADDTPIGYATAHYAASYGDTGSGNSVVHLTRGQRVWLRSNGEGHFWGAATAFSGVLLSVDGYVQT